MRMHEDRYWQQIEAGRPITLTTLLRICEALDVKVANMLEGVERTWLHHPHCQRITRRGPDC